MIDNIQEKIEHWLAKRGIDSPGDICVALVVWVCIPILIICLVKLLATLAGHIAGCL